MRRTGTAESYQERINCALAHIQERLDDPLPLEELAERAHFAPYHFHRIFRGMVGESVKEHIRRLRLERAAQRLRDTPDPGTGIAFDAGYETHESESFTRAFRAMFGELAPTTSPPRFIFHRRRTEAMARTAAAEKIDLYKTHKKEYTAKPEPALVEVGPAKYLTIDGKGEPGGAAFQASLNSLYGAAYTIKMTRKFAGQDYKVCGLEGLWWCPDPMNWMDQPRESWEWKLMIRVPEFIGERDLKAALKQLEAKGKPAGAVKLETLHEGRSVQALHVGPYATEPETVAKMHAFAAAEGLEFQGKHHEIYLSDPRRTAPERLKTILRIPVGGTDDRLLSSVKPGPTT